MQLATKSRNNKFNSYHGIAIEHTHWPSSCQQLPGTSAEAQHCRVPLLQLLRTRARAQQYRLHKRTSNTHKLTMSEIKAQRKLTKIRFLARKAQVDIKN
jgi:hypothetical protein